VEKIYLCGYTPTPKDHPEKMKKTAIGAEEYIRWESHKQTWRILEKLRSKGMNIVALERLGKPIKGAPSCKNIFKYKVKYPVVLVVGHEIKGLSDKILKYCDACLEIPMYGRKESLNVAVAVGIALYALRQK